MRLIGKGTETKKRGQGLVEFSLILPAMLLILFGIIETARLLHAWITIENGARFGVRYAVTGEFEQGHCAGFPGGVCNNQAERDAARIPSIRDAAHAGAASVWHDPSAPDGIPGFLKVTVCSNKAAVTYFPPDIGTSTSADCQPVEDAGGPGDRVIVTVDFDHPLLSPILSSVLPKVRLSARREGIVEQFRVARVVGVPATISVPTFTATTTATKTASPTSTTTSTATPTLCKVPPEVYIWQPEPMDYVTTLPSVVFAYDPDNTSPDDCLTDPTFFSSGPSYAEDGEGIQQVQIRFEQWTGTDWISVHAQNENIAGYCGFGGNGPCTEHNLTSLQWPNGTPIQNGIHRVFARALDDEGEYSNWSVVQFTINMPPTATPTVTLTPTATPTPSCSGVSFGSFQFRSGARISQYIHNTTYPGLEVTGVRIYWQNVEDASALYGWDEHINWTNWNGSRVQTTDDYNSPTDSHRGVPMAVIEGTNANEIRVDFRGGFEDRWNQSPLYLSAANFGFMVQFSDPVCNLYRGETSTTFATPTATPTVTNTATVTSTPTVTRTPTVTPTNEPFSCSDLSVSNLRADGRWGMLNATIRNQSDWDAYITTTTFSFFKEAPNVVIDWFKIVGRSEYWGGPNGASPNSGSSPTTVNSSVNGSTQLNPGFSGTWQVDLDGSVSGIPYGQHQVCLSFTVPGASPTGGNVYCNNLCSSWNGGPTPVPSPTPTNTLVPPPTLTPSRTPTRTQTPIVPSPTSGPPTVTPTPTEMATLPPWDG